MALTHQQLEDRIRQAFPTATIVEIDGCVSQPTLEQLIEHWSKPDTHQSYCKTHQAQVLGPTASIKVYYDTVDPRSDQQREIQTVIIDCLTGAIIQPD